MWQKIVNWFKNLFGGNTEPETPTVATHTVEISATVVKPSENTEVKAVAFEVSGSYDKATRAFTINE